MKIAALFLGLVMGLAAQETKVTPLLAKDLSGIPGKEAMMLTVEYAPGASDAIHRHNAHVFVYVLEGNIEQYIARALAARDE